MNELVVICLAVGLVVLVAVLQPFFFGDGGRLQDASASDSPADLESKLESLLQRWIKDESALEYGEITETEWNQRKRYLIARYVDTARRLHWLRENLVNDGVEK